MESVRVLRSADCGRSLVSASKFSTGKCILEELPYAYVLCNKKRGLFCEFCLKQSSALQRCSSCKYVRYCSRSCQKEDWTRCHKQECKTLKKIHPRVPPDLAQLLAQIIWKQRKSPPCCQDDGACFPKTVDQLESHHQKLSEARRDHFESLLFVLEQCIEDVLPEPSKLLKMFGATICNSFSICDNDLNDIAVGIYLRASMLNHSCDPNCVVVFDERKLQLRTVKDIQEGEECTISYVDVINPVKDRQAELEERYHFTCKCVKCIDESNELKPDDGLDESFLEGLKKTREKVQDAEKIQDWPALLQLCEPYLKPMDSSCSLLANHHLLVKLRDRAFDACIDTQSWEKAAQIGQMNTQPYRHHYGPYHPSLGIHLLKMAKLLLYLERLQEAGRYLTKAEAVLEVTHGKQHSLMLTLVQELLLSCR